MNLWTNPHRDTDKSMLFSHVQNAGFKRIRPKKKINQKKKINPNKYLDLLVSTDYR